MVQTYVSSKILSVGLDLPCHSHMARAERWATWGRGSPLNLTKTHNILAGQKNALPFAAPQNKSPRSTKKLITTNELNDQSDSWHTIGENVKASRTKASTKGQRRMDHVMEKALPRQACLRWPLQ